MRRGLIRWAVTLGVVVGVGYVIAGLLRGPARRRGVPFRGNPSKRVFHDATCRFFDSASSSTEFASRQDALEAGYTPCKLCTP